MSRLFTILKSRKFLPLFVAQFFGAFNDNVFKNAFLIWFTYEIAVKNGSDAGTMNSVAALLFILPFFLFSCFAGQIVDKFEKSGLLRKIKFTEIILMFLAFAGFYFQNYYFLLIILFLMGAQSAMFGPLKYSMPKQLVNKKDLLNASALIEGSTFLAILFGTIFGASLIRAKFGIEIICTTLIIFAATGFVAALFSPKIAISDKNLRINYNIFRQITESLSYARENGNLLKIIILISWFWLLGTVFLTQFPIFARDIIKGDEKIVTLFLIIFSVGIALGSIICAKLSKGQVKTSLICFSIYAISLNMGILFLASQVYQASNNGNLMYFLKNGKIIIFSLLAIAIFAGIYITSLYSAMQIVAKQQFIARIIATNNLLNAFFMVLTSIFMIIAFKIGLKITEIFLIIAILNLFMTKFLPKGHF